MLRSLLLYTALVIGANAATAGEIDFDAAHANGLAKLTATDPTPVTDAVFYDTEGGEHRLQDYAGKVVMLNFWATWCAPCREEMPSLDALEAEMGGDDFAVIALATGRNPLPGIEKFFEETGVANLGILLDPKQQIARPMGVMGMPVTVLIDREGNERARLIGGADWSSEASKQVIRELQAP